MTVPAAIAMIATLLGCGGPPGAHDGVERVDGDQLDLQCAAGKQPVRVRVPPEAVVQTYLCDPDSGRCTGIDHVLDGPFVEVPCGGSPALTRRIRWVAPVRW